MAKEHGKVYVSLNDAEGKELVKTYAPKPRLPGFGAPADWTEKTIPRADGVFRPSDQATLTPIGHTTVIHSTAVRGTRSFVRDGLARLFADRLPIEAGVTFKAQTLLGELSGYVHADPGAARQAINSQSSGTAEATCSAMRRRDLLAQSLVGISIARTVQGSSLSDQIRRLKAAAV